MMIISMSRMSGGKASTSGVDDDVHCRFLFILMYIYIYIYTYTTHVEFTILLQA